MVSNLTFDKRVMKLMRYNVADNIVCFCFMSCALTPAVLELKKKKKFHVTKPDSLSLGHSDPVVNPGGGNMYNVSDARLLDIWPAVHT